MDSVKTKAIALKEAIALLKTEGKEKIWLSGEIFYRIACWMEDVVSIDIDGRWEHTPEPCPFIEDFIVDVDDPSLNGKLKIVYSRRTVNALGEEPRIVHVINEVIIGDYCFANAGGPQHYFTREVETEESELENLDVWLTCEHPWDDIDDEQVQNFDLVVDVIESDNGIKLICLTHQFDGCELLKKVLAQRVLTSFSRSPKNLVVDSTTEPKKYIYGFQLTISWIYATDVWWLIGHEFNDGVLTTFKKLKGLAKVDDNINAVIQEILFLEDVLGDQPIGIQIGVDRFFLTVHLY